MASPSFVVVSNTKAEYRMMNSQTAWEATLGQLQMEMPKSSYETWVRQAELVSYEMDTFIIGVRNAFTRDWLDSRLKSTVCRHLSGLMNRPQAVQFIVHYGETEQPVFDTVREQESIGQPQARLSSSFNKRYAFENFVVGASNRLAHAASLAVAESPAQAYNPLFLYGGVGLGKTHLLFAIGNTALQKGLQVLYVTSEEFTNDLINSIRTHTTPAFRERYRRIDVLLIDDIQFIAGKESTQEEFFHTFNALHAANKQIVVSSDRPPKAMVTLEERLRSRFEWGLAADIQPPDFETRVAILRSKAERAGRTVPADILEMIARQVQSNIRELEGALTRVLAYSDLTNQLLSISLVQSALLDMLPQQSDLKPRQIIDVVAKSFGISSENLLGRSRTAEIALPRQVAMYLLREEADLSFPQIGQELGGRDHTTVMYACDKMAELIETDDRLRRQVLAIREKLYGR
jgi:chromosomal replication initiator protein